LVAHLEKDLLESQANLALLTANGSGERGSISDAIDLVQLDSDMEINEES